MWFSCTLRAENRTPLFLHTARTRPQTTSKGCSSLREGTPGTSLRVTNAAWSQPSVGRASWDLLPVPRVARPNRRGHRPVVDVQSVPLAEHSSLATPRLVERFREASQATLQGSGKRVRVLGRHGNGDGIFRDEDAVQLARRRAVAGSREDLSNELFGPFALQSRRPRLERHRDPHDQAGKNAKSLAVGDGRHLRSGSSCLPACLPVASPPPLGPVAFWRVAGILANSAQGVSSAPLPAGFVRAVGRPRLAAEARRR